MKKIILIGRDRRGKSELLDRFLLPRYGYKTVKYMPDTDGLAAIYLHDLRAEPVCTPMNLVGYCKDRHATPFPKVFDTLAVKILNEIPAEACICIDELGFLENAALRFQKKLFALLDSMHPMLISLKDKPTPFLNAVSAHKNCICYRFIPEQANQLYQKLLDENPWLF